MDDTPVRAAARRLFEALNARDAARLAEFLAPEAVFHFPGTDPVAGPEAIARFLGILWRRFPELRFAAGRVIAEADLAAVEWTNEGKDRKGAPYRNAGVMVLETRDGKIVYLRAHFSRERGRAGPRCEQR